MNREEALQQAVTMLETVAQGGSYDRMEYHRLLGEIRASMACDIRRKYELETALTGIRAALRSVKQLRDDKRLDQSARDHFAGAFTHLEDAEVSMANALTPEEVSEFSFVFSASARRTVSRSISRGKIQTQKEKIR